jgi:hypothetical protein
VVWLIFASDTPATNKHISADEKEYIRGCKAEEKIQDTNTVKIECIYNFVLCFADIRKHLGDRCFDRKGFGVFLYQCFSVISVFMVRTIFLKCLLK